MIALRPETELSVALAYVGLSRTLAAWQVAAAATFALGGTMTGGAIVVAAAAGIALLLLIMLIVVTQGNERTNEP